MHVGNILNLLLTASYAKQHDGLFYFCPETHFKFQWDSQNEAIWFHSNMLAAQNLALMGNCCMPIPITKFSTTQKYYQNKLMASVGLPEWTMEGGGCVRSVLSAAWTGTS